MLTNNNSNMRRIRQRIEELKATAEDQTSSEQYGEVRIVNNVGREPNVQVFFPYKPDKADTANAQVLRLPMVANGRRLAAAAEQHRTLLGEADLQRLRREVASRLMALGYREIPKGFFHV